MVIKLKKKKILNCLIKNIVLRKKRIMITNNSFVIYFLTLFFLTLIVLFKLISMRFNVYISRTLSSVLLH